MVSEPLQVLPGSSTAQVAMPAAGAVAQMMGMKVGDQREVVVTLPQQWHPPQFAGVEVTLAITIKELFDRELPEVGHASTCPLPQPGQPVHPRNMLAVEAAAAPAGQGRRAEAVPTAMGSASWLLQSSSPHPGMVECHARLAPRSLQLSLSLPGPGDTLGLLLSPSSLKPTLSWQLSRPACIPGCSFARCSQLLPLHRTWVSQLVRHSNHSHRRRPWPHRCLQTQLVQCS